MKHLIQTQLKILKYYKTADQRKISQWCNKLRGADLYEKLLKYEEALIKADRVALIDKYAEKLPDIPALVIDDDT